MDDRNSKHHELTKLSSLIDPVEPQSRAEAAYVSYRNLLATGRAVKSKKTYVWFSSAGSHPQIGRLACTSKRIAQQLRASMFVDLKQARSDDEYNKILMTILGDIKQAWPDRAELHHVHTCETGKQCEVDPNGHCSCGFDWSEHQMTVDCRCGPELDRTDAAGKYHFVVHRDLKGKVIG